MARRDIEVTRRIPKINLSRAREVSFFIRKLRAFVARDAELESPIDAVVLAAKHDDCEQHWR